MYQWFYGMDEDLKIKSMEWLHGVKTTEKRKKVIKFMHTGEITPINITVSEDTEVIHLLETETEWQCPFHVNDPSPDHIVLVLSKYNYARDKYPRHLLPHRAKPGDKGVHGKRIEATLGEWTHRGVSFSVLAPSKLPAKVLFPMPSDYKYQTYELEALTGGFTTTFKEGYCFYKWVEQVPPMCKDYPMPFGQMILFNEEEYFEYGIDKLYNTRYGKDYKITYPHKVELAPYVPDWMLQNSYSGSLDRYKHASIKNCKPSYLANIYPKTYGKFKQAIRFYLNSLNNWGVNPATEEKAEELAMRETIPAVAGIPITYSFKPDPGIGKRWDYFEPYLKINGITPTTQEPQPRQVELKTWVEEPTEDDDVDDSKFQPSIQAWQDIYDSFNAPAASASKAEIARAKSEVLFDGQFQKLAYRLGATIGGKRLPNFIAAAMSFYMDALDTLKTLEHRAELGDNIETELKELQDKITHVNVQLEFKDEKGHDGAWMLKNEVAKEFKYVSTIKPEQPEIELVQEAVLANPKLLTVVAYANHKLAIQAFPEQAKTIRKITKTKRGPELKETMKKLLTDRVTESKEEVAKYRMQHARLQRRKRYELSRIRHIRIMKKVEQSYKPITVIAK